MKHTKKYTRNSETFFAYFPIIYTKSCFRVKVLSKLRKNWKNITLNQKESQKLGTKSPAYIYELEMVECVLKE